MKLKSITLTTGIFPPDIGGPASFVPLFAIKLTKQNIKVEVITLCDTNTDYSHLPYKVIAINRKIKKPFRDILVVYHIVKSALKSDVIFSNTLAFESAIASKISRKKLIQKVVGDIAWERANVSQRFKGDILQYQNDKLDIISKLTNFYRDFAIKASTKIITPSYFLKTIVQKWSYKSDDIEVIYNCVEIEKSSKNDEKSSKIVENSAKTSKTSQKQAVNDENEQNSVKTSQKHQKNEQILTKNIKNDENKQNNTKYQIISVARLIPHKGFEAIFHALSGLDFEFQYTIIGTGTLDTKLKALAKELKIDTNFIGNTTKAKVATWLLNSDIFILNSSYEGLPHIVLEAMQNNCTVIASRVGGTPEIVCHEQNGLLFEFNNTKQLIKNINKVKNDKLLKQKMIENGREFTHKFANIDEMVQKYIDFIQKVT